LSSLESLWFIGASAALDSIKYKGMLYRRLESGAQELESGAQELPLDNLYNDRISYSVEIQIL